MKKTRKQNRKYYLHRKARKDGFMVDVREKMVCNSDSELLLHNSYSKALNKEFGYNLQTSIV